MDVPEGREGREGRGNKETVEKTESDQATATGSSSALRALERAFRSSQTRPLHFQPHSDDHVNNILLTTL